MFLPKSWHYLSSSEPEFSLLLAESWVKLSVRFRHVLRAFPTLTRESHRETLDLICLCIPAERAKLVCYVSRGCPSVNRLMWTCFFGLPHWTKHLLVRKRKVRDAFGAAQWLWLLLGTVDGQIGTLLFGYHPALEWAAQAGCRVSILRDIQDPMESGPEQPTLAGLGDIQRSFQHQRFCDNSQLFQIPVFWKPTSHWRVKWWVRSPILHRLDEF